MRLALVSPGYPPTPGGVETVVAQTARALVRAGVAVEVLAQQRRPLRPELSWDEGVLVRRFRCNRAENYRLAPGLYRYLTRHADAFDVVHGHSYHALTGVGAALALRLRGRTVPYVLTPHYHGTGHTPARALLHRAFVPAGRAAADAAHAVLCVSRPEAQLFAADFPTAAGKVTVVPNAVDRTALRAATAFTDQPPTVLSVGRLERYKRVDRLIEAFARLDSAGGGTDSGTDGGTGDAARGGTSGGAQLVVIGTGPDRERLQAVAERCGAARRVRFLGRVGDHELRRWLRTAAVLGSLSEHEAYGLAPAEALAAGAWALLSDIPAHADLPAPQAVRLVPAHASAGAVAQALARCLDAGGRPGPEQIPDWDWVAARLIDVYRAAQAAPSSSGGAR
ncbi:glycosyltransferase involved in cell wall biosynthesis [Kitasatospora sp. MAA4]|uniref:glycosyltransferase family 4 protein n=1 Tax=Kitasatospora sp. MAA4 TaxID=3035093 RepID=UPI002472F63A|nr:glycosyltransferase family 4 protein [Kitasatospora sp. MAA4]MDH6132176.1 glycosyltransferase involved in cell wall biosynthesis [Kitasatospora sp. MAA4]